MNTTTMTTPEPAKASLLGKLAIGVCLFGTLLPIAIGLSTRFIGEQAVEWAFFLFLAFQVIALVLGIFSWRTPSGRASAIASGTLLLLGLLFILMSARSIPSQSKTIDRATATTESKFQAGVTPKFVSTAEFEKEYASVGMAQTMHSVTYLGQRDGRAYIHRSSKSAISGKWSNHVIYVELADLDATFRDSLSKTEMKDPQ